MKTLENNYKDQRNDWEWVEKDINNDGINEFILREKDLFKRIVAVFTFHNDTINLVRLWSGSAHFYDFWNDSGYYISYNFWYGLTSSDSFIFYTIDDNFNFKPIYYLCVFQAYDFSEYDTEWWYENHPYIIENGVGTYYIQSYLFDETEKAKELEYISEEKFSNTFKEMTGFDFYDIITK